MDGDDDTLTKYLQGRLPQLPEEIQNLDRRALREAGRKAADLDATAGNDENRLAEIGTLHGEFQDALQKLADAGVPTYAVGKVADIYAQRGITESVHTGNTVDSQHQVETFYRDKPEGLIFANFIDFDMLYGHRRDAVGYGRALEQTDAFFGRFIERMRHDDLLVITADHGNDPTFKGTDHTREYVPLLVYQPNHTRGSLGMRRGFYDVAQSLASFFGIDAMPRGVSFL